MEPEVLNNHARYIERVKVFKSFGYDINKERNYILAISKPFSGKILEFGTGKGHFTMALASLGYECTSVDVSEEALHTARLNLAYAGLENKVTLKIENGNALSFKDGTFDVVFSINTLHHLEDPVKVLDEIARVIKDKGKLIFSDFTEKGFKIINAIHQSEGGSHNEGKANINDIKELLTHKGMNINAYTTEFQETIIANKV